MSSIFEKQIEKLNSLKTESPELVDLLRDVLVIVEKINNKVNEMNSVSYRVKSSLPWPWNVDIAPFPEAWKRAENRANPDAFLLPELQPLDQSNGWREARNSRLARQKNSTESISTSNRFTPLSSGSLIEEPAEKSKAIINFKKGNVLDCYNKSSIVHCIGQDATMGKGFALQVNKKFNCREQILAQQKNVGQVSSIDIGQDQYLFNLVTKPKSGEPPADTKGLFDSLTYLRDFCDTFSIKHLSMPKIASGLNQIPWKRVQTIIEQVFENSEIQLDIYSWSPKKDYTYTRNNENDRHKRVVENQGTKRDFNASKSDNSSCGSVNAEVLHHGRKNYANVVTVVQSVVSRGDVGVERINQHRRGRHRNISRDRSVAASDEPVLDNNARSCENPGVILATADVLSCSKEPCINAVEVLQSGECRSIKGHNNVPQSLHTSLSVRTPRVDVGEERADQHRYERHRDISREESDTASAMPVRDTNVRGCDNPRPHLTNADSKGDFNASMGEESNANRQFNDMETSMVNDLKGSQVDNIQYSILDTDKVLTRDDVPLEQNCAEQSESQVMERVHNFLKKQTPKLWKKIHLAATEVPLPSADDSFASCYSANELDEDEEIDLDDTVDF